MNLTAHQVRQIIAGRKTEHRVPITQPRDIKRRNGTKYTSTPFTPRTGLQLVARVPGRDLACRIVVLEATQAVIGDITLRDALAEGHKTTAQFRIAWVHCHDHAWISRNQPNPEQPLEDQQIIERFDSRHANTPVWAIRFQIDRRERPRLLTPAGSARGDDRDYTDTIGYRPPRTDPTPFTPTRCEDEPDGVDDTWLAKFATEARDKDHARSIERPIAWRLEQALRQAEAAGIDVTRQRQAIERRIATIARQAQQRAA